MEKNHKTLRLGLIIALISLIGIIITLLCPLIVLCYPLQLVFTVFYVVGILKLTKGLIKNRYEKIYWFLFLSTGALAIISMFTPEGFRFNPTEIFWLWDLNNILSFPSGVLFFIILVLIATGGIIFISIKSIHQFYDIIEDSRFLKVLANFLIVSSACLFVGKDLFGHSILPGFALLGPFSLGIMTKTQLKIFRKNLEFPQDEYQSMRNKVAYAKTMVGGYILIILSFLIDIIGATYFTILPATFVNFILGYNQTIVIIIACIAFSSVFCALFYPRGGVILLLITGIMIAITALLISWLYIVPIFLIAPDLHKTRKIVKLAENQ